MGTLDPRIRKTKGYGYLHEKCDVYFNPRFSRIGGALTFFNTKGVLIQNDVDKANLCLKHFNTKNNKYFTLEKIVKLNIVFSFFCMTIMARDFETGEIHYLRGVADRSRKAHGVTLCEIKEDGHVGLEIPPGHEDYFEYSDPFYPPENRPSKHNRRKKKSLYTRLIFHCLLSAARGRRREKRLRL